MSEEQTLSELRRTILDLPLGELNTLKISGLNGFPLHKALGFSSEFKLRNWLAGENAEPDEESEEEAKRFQKPKSKKIRLEKSQSDSESEASENEKIVQDNQKLTKNKKKKGRNHPSYDAIFWLFFLLTLLRITLS